MKGLCLQEAVSESSHVTVISVEALGGALTGTLEDMVRKEPDFFTTADIRTSSIKESIRRFRGRKMDVLLLVCENEQSSPVLPVMQVFALFLGARRVYTVAADGSVKKSGFASGICAGITTCRAILSGWLALRRSRADIDWLLAAPRQRVAKGTEACLFIKVASIGSGNFGGALAHFIGLINAFARLGKNCIAISGGDFSGFEKHVSFLKVPPVDGMAPPLRALRSASEINTLRMNAAYLSHMKQKFDKTKPEFIYQRLTIGAYCGVDLARQLGVPLVVEFNGSEVWVAANWGVRLANEELFADIERACLRHANIVVCVSTVLRDILIEQYCVEPDRIVCHPNGVDTSVFDPARFDAVSLLGVRKKFGLTSANKLVTFIGTFGKWHGAEVFAQAIAKLIRTDKVWLDDRSVKFMFIGDGTHRRDAEQIIHAAGASEYTIFTKAVQQELAPKYLATADLFVSPHVENSDASPFFGSPTKLFEYLAMGKPVIASDLDQIGEIFDDCPSLDDFAKDDVDDWQGEFGLRVRPGDADQLANAIKILIDRPLWREQAGIAARRHVINNFTWDRHVLAIANKMAEIC